jgi:hypothetical protein
MSNYVFAFLFLTLALSPSCTIYQSPDRRSFESESPLFKTQSLQKVSCSSESMRKQASQSRLITIINDTSPNILLWEHLINNASKYESESFSEQSQSKEYCIYEKSN